MSVFSFSRVRLLLILLLLDFVPAAAGPAQELPAAWRMDFMDLKIEIDPLQGQLRGDARLRVESLGSGPGADNILLEFNHELAVLSVTDGADRPLDFDRDGGTLTVHSGKRSSQTKNRTIRVRYQGSFSERVPELDFYNAWIGPDISYASSPSLGPWPASEN